METEEIETIPGEPKRGHKIPRHGRPNTIKYGALRILDRPKPKKGAPKLTRKLTTEQLNKWFELDSVFYNKRPQDLAGVMDAAMKATSYRLIVRRIREKVDGEWVNGVRVFRTF